MSTTTDFLQKYKKPLIGGFAALIVIIVIFSLIGYVNGTRRDGIDKETALSAQYQQNQNTLATYINQFNEELGISDRAANKVDKILLDAVQGRYKDTSATPGSGGLFSAISEAYPDLTATTQSYAKVQDLVESGRNSFKDDQQALLDRLRDYNSWRNNDLFRSIVVGTFGFPTDNLQARNGSQVLYGKAALEKMSTIITNAETQDAYNSGQSGPLITPEADSNR
jgi:hypothetical protein